MIQFNLLPDIKTQHIKVQRLKHTIVLVAVLATIASVIILIFSISYSAVQKRHLANLDKDIVSISNELKGNSELNRILSVQNQLNVLPTLYNGRPAVERLPGYIDQTTPQSVSISRFNIDFSTSVIEITGQASSLENVNSYVDTLKYTTFKNGADSESVKAFTNVVLSKFGKDSKESSFVINFSFDPLIFDKTLEVSLSVPSLVTTRAEGSPTELFDGAQIIEEGGQDGGQ